MKAKQHEKSELEVALLNMLKKAWSDYYAEQGKMLRRSARGAKMKRKRPVGQL